MNFVSWLILSLEHSSKIHGYKLFQTPGWEASEKPPKMENPQKEKRKEDQMNFLSVFFVSGERILCLKEIIQTRLRFNFIKRSISHYSYLVSWRTQNSRKWLYFYKYEELPQFLSDILDYGFTCLIDPLIFISMWILAELH